MSNALLPLTFSILKFCGFWKPCELDDKANWTRWAYDGCTILVIFMVVSFSICGLMDIALNVDNVEELTGNIFILLTLISAFCKGTNVLVRRKDIIGLKETLLSGFCKPQDTAETYIQSHFDRTAKLTTMYYMALIQTSVSLMTLRTLFDVKKSAILPFKIWLPYNYSSSTILLWGTYVYETGTNVMCSFLHIASESLVSGLMMQTCAQLEILKYRLQRVPGKTSSRTPKNGARMMLLKCIRHHNLIIEIAKRLNRIFKPVFIAQFTVSSIVVCSSVYLLAKLNIASIQFVSLFFYVASILVQLFLYCWYGNEVILKSIDMTDAIYEMDWTVLDVKSRKILLIMMIRSTAPIQFTDGFFMTLSIDSYMSILKFSYSVYNVLQQSSV